MDRRVSLQGAVRAIADPRVVMRRVVDQVLALIQRADGAAVELRDGEGLVYASAAGSLGEREGARVSTASSLSGRALQEGRPVYCADAGVDAQVVGAAAREVGQGSMICVPLSSDEAPVGVLNVAADRPRAFTEDDVVRLGRIAGFVSSVIRAACDLARSVGRVVDGPDEMTSASAGEAQPPRDLAADAASVERHALSRFVANVLRPGAGEDVILRQRVEHVVQSRQVAMVVQPIVDLGTGQLAGVEALARFSDRPARSPDAWFADAARVGLAVELQLTAVRRALQLLDRLPSRTFLSINVGPDALAESTLRSVLAHVDTRRIVLELTEHLKIDDYPRLQDVLGRLRADGARVAIDDIGTGFASLGHFVHLAPDLIKLERVFTAGIDLDPVRRSVARSVVALAHETGADIVAEGIETQGELETVATLGIRYGQGYLLGRPAPVEGLTTSFARGGDHPTAAGPRPQQAGVGA